MRYLSTRGGAVVGDALSADFTDILLGGLAADGGLAMPERIPTVDSETLNSWRSLSYASLAFEVLQRFATDIPLHTLQSLIDRSYTA
ncbi:MAG: threonine synthase, partial [Betaproteobacteria bacterium]|nr:threonine synthase [Betaproteobacteria bacterium]